MIFSSEALPMPGIFCVNLFLFVSIISSILKSKLSRL